MWVFKAFFQLIYSLHGWWYALPHKGYQFLKGPPKIYHWKEWFFFITSIVAWPFPTIWGFLDRARMKDCLELQFLEKVIVHRFRVTIVPPLKDLLQG